MSLAGKPPFSQRLLARLTFGQVFYWRRPEDAISKRGEIKVVNWSPRGGLVPGGIVMGLENGPSGEPFTFAPSIDDPLLSGNLYLFAPSIDDPLLSGNLYLFAPSIDDPLLHHRSPPGGVFIVAKISYQRHNKMFVRKDIGNIASVNTQRLSGGVNDG